MKFQAARYRSLSQPLLERFRNDPERVALTIVHDDESEETLTVRQLHLQACACAARLREAGLRPGDITILALRHCRELITFFWGCIYAGMVPAIVAYKGPMTTAAAYSERLASQAASTGCRLVVTLPELKAEAEDSLAATGCRVLAIHGAGNGGDDAPAAAAEVLSSLPPAGGEDIAYLQFSSGSSGSPKGVLLSHRAVLNQAQAFSAAMRMRENDKVVNWLPLYHDFGLFGGLVIPLFASIPSVLLSPFKWLRNPLFHLRLIQRHAGTISFMPNSALNHTLRFAAGSDLRDLDLSCLRVLLNGAEPILYESQREFLRRFAGFGFRESALANGYGMAENTLGVTLSMRNRRHPADWVWVQAMHARQEALPAPPRAKGAKPNVSSGRAMENMEIAILNAAGRHLPERSIGEIALKSPSLFSGYLADPGRTAAVLKGGWYHSGDLGYIAAGHLYVCGRKKDLIIVGGHNIHPEDLERVAAGVPGIHADRVVALGVMDKELGTEKIVMLCGLEKPAGEKEQAALEKELRRQVFASMEITLAEVRFVEKNWIERTQNGKIARPANLEKYEKLMRST
jgi:acyl-CoA synthetase (AMP-forming)/AMP-acid ligase II